MRGFVFGMLESSWALDENRCCVEKLEAYMDARENFSRHCEARFGNGFWVRDLDKFMMQLGKCLAETIPTEE